MMLSTLMQDVRFALRQLRRSPGFAVTAVLTLALGIGANTAIFSLLDQALLRSLPVRDPERLVVLSNTGTAWEGWSYINGGSPATYFSYPMYRDLRDKNVALEGLAATAPVTVGIGRDGGTASAPAEIVSGNYFHMLGVVPAAGRLIGPPDDTLPGANPVAVLSYRYWRDTLGGDRAVVGQTLSINGHPYQVLGVTSPAFRSAVWGQNPDVFLPMSMAEGLVFGLPEILTQRQGRWLSMIGRLKPGISAASATVALEPLWYALRADELKYLGHRSPKFVAGFLTNSRLNLLPGSGGLSYNRDDLKTPLLAVMGMALLVLVIATVNMASLLLVRAASRTREFAMRFALGAGRGRILMQLLLEGLLLGLAGAAAGLLLAPLALRSLVNTLTSAGQSALFATTIDARLLLFSMAISLLVSVLFSLPPMISLVRPNLVSSVRQQQTTSSAGMLLLRRGIVALQIGASALLLLGATLFVRTLHNLRTVNAGFETSHLLTFHADPTLADIAPEQQPALRRRLLEIVESLPGVERAGATTNPELAEHNARSNITVEGHAQAPDENTDVERCEISPAYLETLRQPLVVGRAFTGADDVKHPLAAIVNVHLAERYFGSAPAAVGKRLAFGAGSGLEFRNIVGVVGNVRHQNVRAPYDDMVYTPLSQSKSFGDLSVYVRTALTPESGLEQMRSAVRSQFPSLAEDGLRSMQAQIDEILPTERVVEVLSISFAGLASLLAGVGLYGVLAFSTERRTREIGIRMALGSSRAAITRLVLRDVLGLTGLGIVVAVPASVLLLRLLRSQLFGVSAGDPWVVLLVLVSVATIVLAAAAVPARRAVSVEPTEALRSE